MAIRRCPYCKAIIDEGAEYCTNCGTKLLFPEDELIEEEIPGEKIFDPDFQDKKPPPPKKRKPRKKKSDIPDEKNAPPLPLTKKGEELFAKGEELPGIEAVDEAEKPFDTAIFPPQEDDGEVDDIQDPDEKEDFFTVDAPLPIDEEEVGSDIDGDTEIGIEPEIAEEESEEIPFEGEPLTEDVPVADEKITPENDIVDEEPVELIEDQSWEDQPPVQSDLEDETAPDVISQEEMGSEPPAVVDSHDEGSRELVPDSSDFVGETVPAEMEEGGGEEPEAGGQDVDFKTEDLESIVDPAEKEKEDIERFLDALKKERKDIDTPEAAEVARQEEIPPAEEPWEPVEDEDEELPAWAENGREEIPVEDEVLPLEGTPVESEPDLLVEEEEQVEAEARDVEEPEEEDIRAEAETRDAEEPEEEEKPPATMGLPEGVNQKPLPFGALLQAEQDASVSLTREKAAPSGFGLWMKARLFDVLFIGLFWVISVGAASLVLGVSLLQLVSTATLAVILYYVILLLIYFFLFFFFLGETIGDHLFAKED